MIEPLRHGARLVFAGNTAGNGIAITGTAGEGWSPAVALSALTGNWSQTGAFDIILDNAASELQIEESVGATFFGTIDVGDLAANATYTFSGVSGTVATSANIASYATTGVSAGSGLTGGGTVGSLSLDIGAGAGISVAADSISAIRFSLFGNLRSRA